MKKKIKHETETIVVLDKEAKENAGLNVKKIRDFSGGCGGLKEVKEE